MKSNCKIKAWKDRSYRGEGNRAARRMAAMIPLRDVPHHPLVICGHSLVLGLVDRSSPDRREAAAAWLALRATEEER